MVTISISKKIVFIFKLKVFLIVKVINKAVALITDGVKLVRKA